MSIRILPILLCIYLILISQVLIDFGQGKNNPADSINEKKWEGKSANGLIDSVYLVAYEKAPKRSNYYYIRIYINLSEKVNPGDIVEMKIHPPNERECNNDPSTHYNDYVDYDGQKKNISFEFCPRDLINPKLGNYSTEINVLSGDIKKDHIVVPFPWISVLYDLYDDPDSKEYDSIPKKAGVTIVKENITYALQVKALKNLKVSLSVYPKDGTREYIPNTRQTYLNAGREKEIKWIIPCECLGSIGISSCNKSKIVPVLEEL
jgi:hypothetical protein